MKAPISAAFVKFGLFHCRSHSSVWNIAWYSQCYIWMHQAKSLPQTTTAFQFLIWMKDHLNLWLGAVASCNAWWQQNCSIYFACGIESLPLFGRARGHIGGLACVCCTHNLKHASSLDLLCILMVDVHRQTGSCYLQYFHCDILSLSVSTLVHSNHWSASQHRVHIIIQKVGFKTKTATRSWQLSMCDFCLTAAILPLAAVAATICKI